MRHAYSSDGILFEEDIPSTGDTVLFAYGDIRRERTGVHAKVSIGIRWAETQAIRVLASSVYNIGRTDDRSKLARDAAKDIGADDSRDVLRKTLTSEWLTHGLLVTGEDAVRLWEIDRVQVVEWSDDDEIPEVNFIVRPYLMAGGGTIFYAAPGSNKSYLLQSMALSIGQACRTIWDVQVAMPCLYVNLERDGVSLQRRERALKSALDLSGRTNVSYINSAGMALPLLRRRIIRWLEENQGPVLLDSISRAGMGTLVDDEAANSVIDLLNQFRHSCWAAIAHKPRNGDHVFGSQMWDAGADLVVNVSTEERMDGETFVNGVALTIEKANDIAKGAPMYLALEFDDPFGPVSRIRKAGSSEFTGLTTRKEMGPEDRIDAYLQGRTNEVASGQDIARDLKMDAGQVSRILRTSQRFYFVRDEHNGRSTFKLYGRATDRMEP